MLHNLLVFPLLVLAVVTGPAQAPAASFELLGQFPHPDSPSSHAHAVSADGEVVVGDSRMGADSVDNILPFRWTPAEGMVNFFGVGPGEGGGRAYDVSADGSVIVGSGGFFGGESGAFRWTEEEGALFLPSPAGSEGYPMKATGVSADGSVVVGVLDDPEGHRLFRWTEAERMVDLGPESGSWSLIYPHVSDDGSLIVANDGEGAFRWTQETGRVYLGTLPGAAGPAIAYNVSADGSAIVGSIPYPVGEPGDQAFRWTEEEGIVLLFGAPRESDSIAMAVSGHGSLVVGTWDDSFDGFIWDAGHGPRDLHRVLENEYGLEIGDFWLGRPMDVSPDGRVIVGAGEGPRGFEAWRAVIPEPSTTALLIMGLLALLLLIGSRKRNGVDLFFTLCSYWKGNETMVRNLWVFPLVVLVVLIGSAQAIAVSFELLGQFPNPDNPTSWAGAVSADGQVVIGGSRMGTYDGDDVPFRWTAIEGMVDFVGEPGRAKDVSADGSVVVGYTRTGVGPLEPFRWSEEDGVVMLSIPADWEGWYRAATGVSADGSVIVGQVGSDDDGRLFRWTESEGMVDLGLQVSIYPGTCPQISADGSVVVGNDPERGAFRWTQQTGQMYLGTLSDAFGNPFAYEVSADGSVIVGKIDALPVDEASARAFRWTQEGGFELLVSGPSVMGNTAQAVSGDGSVILGMDHHDGAFIWDTAHGARDLGYVLEEEYGLNLGGFHLSQAAGISPDGRVIVGSGYYGGGLDGSEAWRVVIPEPSTTALLIAGLLALLLFAWRKRNAISGRFCSTRLSC